MKLKADVAVLAFLLLAETHMSVSIAGTIEVVSAPEECVLAVNLLRAAKLSEGVPLLSNDPDAEEKAKEQLRSVVAAAHDNCDQLAAQDKLGEVGLFSAKYQGSTPPCKKGMQELLERFLERTKGFGDTGLPAYSEETEPWSSLEGGLLAQALHAKSQKIGCAVTKNCDQGNVIICFFDPSLQENETPFSDAVFKALKERVAAGHSIADMTAADLKGVGVGNSAYQILPPPALFVISLTAALTIAGG